MSKIKKRLIFSLSLAILAGPSMATIIFSDDFSDGNRNGWFRYAQTGNSTLDVSSGRMELSSSETTGDLANNVTAVRPFAVVDMSVVGTKVTLQLDFVNLQTQPNNRGMNIGLYNSNGTVINADTSAGTAGENDSGWWTRMGRNAFMHNLYGGTETGGIRAFGGSGFLRANDNANTDIRVNGTVTDINSIFTVTNDPQIWYTYKMEVEALVGGHHKVTASFLEGSTLLSTMTYTDTTGAIVGNIDSVGFTSMAGNDFLIDNVSVSVIPEPGTLALMLISVSSILLFRRRQS